MFSKTSCRPYNTPMPVGPHILCPEKARKSHPISCTSSGRCPALCAASTSVVNSLVNDVIMPPIGLATGGVDFSNMFIDLSRSGRSSVAAAKEAGAPVVSYGVFINTVLDFVIVAFAIFLLVRGTNRMKKAEPPPAPSGPSNEEKLLTEIRDLLKTR